MHLKNLFMAVKPPYNLWLHILVLCIMLYVCLSWENLVSFIIQHCFLPQRTRVFCCSKGAKNNPRADIPIGEKGKFRNKRKENPDVRHPPQPTSSFPFNFQVGSFPNVNRTWWVYGEGRAVETHHQTSWRPKGGFQEDVSRLFSTICMYYFMWTMAIFVFTRSGKCLG